MTSTSGSPATRAGSASGRAIAPWASTGAAARAVAGGTLQPDRVISFLATVVLLYTPLKSLAPYSEFPADMDPYACLKKSGAISDGCLAMEGYLDVIGSDGERSRAAREALERYCRVDTLAMFYVLDYWAWRLAGGRETATTAGQGGTAS